MWKDQLLWPGLIDLGQAKTHMAYSTILVKNVGALDTDCAKFDSHINNKHSNPPFPPFNVVCSVLYVQGVTQH
jgi:hypothetical protein